LAGASVADPSKPKLEAPPIEKKGFPVAYVNGVMYPVPPETTWETVRNHLPFVPNEQDHVILTWLAAGAPVLVQQGSGTSQ
jgi:hypothetical protein